MLKDKYIKLAISLVICFYFITCFKLSSNIVFGQEFGVTNDEIKEEMINDVGENVNINE